MIKEKEQQVHKIVEKNRVLLSQIQYDKQQIYRQLHKINLQSYNLIKIIKMDELNFDKILKGQDQGASQKKQSAVKPTQKKLTQSQTRTRQQSCMITQIDKNLIPGNINPTNPSNFRVSLSDMLHIDKNDESLQNYKKNLLGEIKEEQLKQDESAQVEIVKIEVICPNRPSGNVTLNINNNEKKFKIKQGQLYRLRIHFIVRFDIVNGLKYVNNVYKFLMRVDQQQQKMGSFAPQQKPHVFDLPWIEAPTGILARGEYKGKGFFLDADGIVHCQFNYTCEIGSDW